MSYYEYLSTHTSRHLAYMVYLRSLLFIDFNDGAQ